MRTWRNPIAFVVGSQLLAACGAGNVAREGPGASHLAHESGGPHARSPSGTEAEGRPERPLDPDEVEGRQSRPERPTDSKPTQSPFSGSGPSPGAPSAARPPPRPTTLPLSRGGGSEVNLALEAGDRAFEAGNLDEAQKHYEAAKKVAQPSASAAGPAVAPTVGLARVRMARAGIPLEFAAGKGNRELTRAIADLQAAVRSDPAYGPGHVELGRARLLAGEAELATESLQKGVLLLPGEPEAHSALGIALLATGHADQAVAPLGRAAELDPGSAPRHANLGTVLLMRGLVADAIREYESVVSLSGGDARAHSDLGTALLASGDLVRATRELEEAVRAEPQRATFRSNLGYALQLQGRAAEALGHYREATKLDPKLVSAWVNLATLLARDPKTRSEARRALETAKKIDPTDPRVKANLDELEALEAGRRAP